MIAVVRRIAHEYVDFAHVPVSQWKIHDRLEAWAKWCRGSERQTGSASSPMFELYRSTDAKRAERLYGGITEVPVDKYDAEQIQKGMARLPDKNRRAIQWSYLHPRNPSAMARELGVDLSGLQRLVTAGRFKLMDMGI